MANAAEQAERERDGLRQYCRQATDKQLPHIYFTERARAQRANDPESFVGQTAKVFAEEAKNEMARRGMVENT